MQKIPISFNFDEDIFWLFVSLNLTGYDDENNNKGMHPLRKAIRKNLTSYQENNQNLNNLKLLYSKKHQSHFVEWIIQKKYNKKIISRYSSTELDFFKNFDSTLLKFIVSVKKEKVFSKAKKVYLEEKENEYKNINRNLNKLINTLNADFSFNKIIIIPNFLDAYERGYAPKVNDIAFVIYGPQKKSPFRTIRHELLHSIINPLTIDNKPFIEKFSEYKFDDKNKKKMGYNDWSIIITEYLIRSIEIKYTNTDQGEKRKMIEQERKNGFTKIEYFYSQLKNTYKPKEFFITIQKIINDDLIQFL